MRVERESGRVPGNVDKLAQYGVAPVREPAIDVVDFLRCAFYRRNGRIRNGMRKLAWCAILTTLIVVAPWPDALCAARQGERELDLRV